MEPAFFAWVSGRLARRGGRGAAAPRHGGSARAAGRRWGGRRSPGEGRAEVPSLRKKKNNAVVKLWRVALTAALRRKPGSRRRVAPRLLPAGKPRALRKRRGFLCVCVRFARAAIVPDGQRGSRSRLMGVAAACARFAGWRPAAGPTRSAPVRCGRGERRWR